MEIAAAKNAPRHDKIGYFRIDIT